MPISRTCAASERILLGVVLAIAATTTPAVAADQDHVNYFIDASGSMCGYLSANDPANTFRKIVNLAMQSKDAKRDRRVFLLGSDGNKPTLSEAPENFASKVAQHVEAKGKGTCASFVANDSSLDGVFAQAKKTPGSSMILVTDLLLKEGELTSFVDNVREWASTSGNEAAHVGFITLRAPFDGPYFQVSGGKANPGRHIRPLTVMWFSASPAGREEVGRLLVALGETPKPVQASADVASSRCQSEVRSAPAPQATASGPSVGGVKPKREPASEPAGAAEGAVMFGLQVLPKLTADRSQWFVPMPERGLDKWLDLQCQMLPGSGRNRNSVDECASAKWAANALQITVRERCNDKELFPFKQTSAVVVLKPRAATGLVLDRLQVTSGGAARCGSMGPNAAVSQCSESDHRNEVLQLYRLPLADKNNEAGQKVEVQLRMLEPEDSSWLARAERLDVASDLCTATAKAEDCRAWLDGKVYRYSTFVAQLAGRAKAVMQQRIDALPHSFTVQVKVVPGAK